MGSPKVREGYGDGVPVVVGGVTPAQSGDRENRTTGRRGTGDERIVTMKDAQCKRLKWCWAFSANAAGRACRARSFTGRCSMRTCTCWLTGTYTRTTGQ